MSYYYNGKDPVEIEENSREAKAYNKLAKNMSALKVAEFRISTVGDYRVVTHLYLVEDFNYPRYSDIKKDSTKRSVVVTQSDEIVSQKSYVGIIAIRTDPNKECKDKSLEPCKFYENVSFSDEYYALCDPRSVIIERNYPKPYCDIAEELISKQQDNYINQIKFKGKNIENGKERDTVINLSEDKDFLTNVAIDQYYLLNSQRTTHTTEELLEDDGKELE